MALIVNYRAPTSGSSAAWQWPSAVLNDDIATSSLSATFLPGAAIVAAAGKAISYQRSLAAHDTPLFIL